jgi:glycerol-3-phosphate dehydrogenase subunit C
MLCEIACPSGVKIGHMNLEAKHARVKTKGTSRSTYLLTRGYLVNRLASPFARVVNPVLEHAFVRKVMEKTVGIDARRNLPSIYRQRFQQWARKRRKRPGNSKALPVAYFYGCFIDSSDPSLGKVVVQCLEKLGLEVIFPRQTCCGVARIASGDMEGARRLASKNARWLGKVLLSGIPVVVSSPSCGLALKQEYKVFLQQEVTQPGEPARVYDCFQYLSLLVDEKRVSLDSLLPVPRRIYYHTACHMKALGVGLPAVEVLRRIPELEVVITDAGCCGLGGTYGFKRENFDVSSVAGQDLRDALRVIQPEVVVTECEGCRMQIEQSTGVSTAHPIELLARALGLRGREHT